MPRVMRAARVFSPSPKPSIMPAAMAMTFLTEPPSSTPTVSSTRVHPEVGRGKDVLHPLGQHRVAGGHRDHGRQLPGHLHREAGAGQDPHALIGELQRFLQHPGHGQMRAVLDPLGCRDHHGFRAQRAGHGRRCATDEVGRHHDDDQSFSGDHPRKVGGGRQIRGQRDARQEQAVFPQPGDLLDHFGLEHPQVDREAFRGEQVGQRRAPAAAADDTDPEISRQDVHVIRHRLRPLRRGCRRPSRPAALRPPPARRRRHR